MNKSGTTIILTGLSIILINNLAIAQEIPANVFNTCTQTNNQPASAINPNTKELKLSKVANEPNTLASAKSNLNVTQASFWWAAEQFDPFNGRLVVKWLTYPQQQQINLIVNWQLWTLLDYFGRYRFVNQFGTVARKYGYSLNIFNQTDQCLASYKYNPASNPPKWELNLEKSGRDSLPIEPQQQLQQLKDQEF
ncbi:MAG: hypothetical protein ACFCU7_05160 [Pleurocapsa sp.]